MVNDRVFVIAEAGVNHNGDSDLAFQLVDVAAEAGADAVKFQTFSTERIVTRDALKAPYQRKATDTGDSQFEMLASLELSYKTHRDLKKYSEARGLQFMSTAFDVESLKFLVSDLQLELLKIPSGELTNGPLLLEYAKSGRDLILSTGMSTTSEIREALALLAFGLAGGRDPSVEGHLGVTISEKGQSRLKDQVVLLHCTTEYPAPPESINLRAIGSMRDEFELRVGYSDHSLGISIPCAAVALGSRVIEKHFTLDKCLSGPDHSSSLEPAELRAMVESIRIIELAQGDGVKEPHKVEIRNRNSARKSLVASRNIACGETFTVENLDVKRPGTGRSPMTYWSILGTRASKQYQLDELI